MSKSFKEILEKVKSLPKKKVLTAPPRSTGAMIPLRNRNIS